MKKNNLILLFILCIGIVLRVYGIDWDQGFHLHPDERMLIMVADRIHFFDALNPQFFNYGSLPIYLLKGLSQLIDYFTYANISDYQGMLYVGRGLSVFFDIVTIIFIYKIGVFVFKKSLPALAASFLYSVAFFPIQNSHFFVVDVLLTMLATALIYLLLIYSKNRRWTTVILIGIVSAALMATKFTSIIFVGLTSISILFLHIKKGKMALLHGLFFLCSFLLFHFLFMPYAFIESSRFISDVMQQTAMSSNPYIFPYTLQYVGTIPYWYYLKNIVLWGLGPFISLLFSIGIVTYIVSKKGKKWERQEILVILFYLVYFLVIGRTAVKFMRYMLPLYPFFVLCAGYGFMELQKRTRSILFFIIGGALIWVYIFVNIYALPHTRIAATDWILTHIPQGSHILTEHWDDVVPLTGGERYQMSQLALYDRPDTEGKWALVDEQLANADYIIIASNRLYTPLQRLVDCNKYEVCYPQTAHYYQKLFAGTFGFKKIAEFSSYPHMHIGQLELTIPDDSADESFTVYDHPKIMIYKKK